MNKTSITHAFRITWYWITKSDKFYGFTHNAGDILPDIYVYILRSSPKTINCNYYGQNSYTHAQAIRIPPAQTQAADHSPPRKYTTTTIAQALFSDSQCSSQRLEDKLLYIATKSIGSVSTE